MGVVNVAPLDGIQSQSSILSRDHFNGVGIRGFVWNKLFIGFPDDDEFLHSRISLATDLLIDRFLSNHCHSRSKKNYRIK